MLLGMTCIFFNFRIILKYFDYFLDMIHHIRDMICSKRHSIHYTHIKSKSLSENTL